MTGIIGFGRMGEAIAKGLKQKSFEVCVYDISPARVELARKMGLTVCESLEDLVARSREVFIAVKPQSFSDVADCIKGRFEGDQIVVSVMAGVSISRLRDELGWDRIVRVMPNTPALVAEGAIACSFSGSLDEGDRERVLDMLRGLGRVVCVKEDLMDAVTGLSGSGPAYVFLFIEALEDAGVKLGLDRETSRLLALQTVKGAAVLMEKGRAVPRELINAVTSPGGTTIAALSLLEREGFKGILIDAVEAAARRSRELGQG